MKTLYFDEAGYTGNNLLDNDQQFFCYLGIESNSEIERIFKDLKTKYNYDSSEVKGKNICKSSKGQKLLKEMWGLFSPNVRYVVHNKKYALAAKLFEYTYEPVFANVSSLIYGSGFHKFMATFFYTGFMLSDKTAEAIFEGFCRFVKEKTPGVLLELLGTKPDSQHPLKWFYNFCVQHREEIASDVDFTTSTEHWLLDLTSTSLFSLLTQFSGNSNESLKVLCDESKPLFAEVDMLNNFVGDTRLLFQELAGKKIRLNFNLEEPISLVPSSSYVSIQIADILASSICFAIKNEDTKIGKELLELSSSSFMYDNSVLPLSLLNDYSKIESELHFRLMYELSRKINKERKLEKIRMHSLMILHSKKLIIRKDNM
jgi:hypothetical protein